MDIDIRVNGYLWRFILWFICRSECVLKLLTLHWDSIRAKSYGPNRRLLSNPSMCPIRKLLWFALETWLFNYLLYHIVSVIMQKTTVSPGETHGFFGPLVKESWLDHHRQIPGKCWAHLRGWLSPPSQGFTNFSHLKGLNLKASRLETAWGAQLSKCSWANESGRNWQPRQKRVENCQFEDEFTQMILEMYTCTHTYIYIHIYFNICWNNTWYWFISIFKTWSTLTLKRDWENCCVFLTSLYKHFRIYGPLWLTLAMCCFFW